MGNSPSTDQGSQLHHGQRDVSASVYEEQHDWSEEQAEAPETHSLLQNGKSYIDWNNIKGKTQKMYGKKILALYIDVSGKWLRH